MTYSQCYVAIYLYITSQFNILKTDNYRITRNLYIFTNFHVVSKGKIVKVKLGDGKEQVAKIIGFDINSDIAILKVLPEDLLVPIKIADSSNIKIGDKVLYGKWGGTEVKVDGQEFIIMKETDIMGIIN